MQIKKRKSKVKAKRSRPSSERKKRALQLAKPESGWISTKGIKAITGRPPKFVSENQGEKRIMIHFFVDSLSGDLRGKVWLGPDCEGPPQFAHGGCVAAILDEAMGQAAWQRGLMVVAGRIEVDFRAPVPLLKMFFLKATVSETQGRKVFTQAQLLTDKGEILAESKGLFVQLNEQQMKLFRQKQNQSQWPLT